MLDSIGYFLKPIEHTVYVAFPVSADPTWHKFITPIISVLGVAVAVFGWRANSAFARRNQLKAFEESVIDKIRIEFNEYFLEYETWIDNVSPCIQLMFDREDARRTKFKADTKAETEHRLIKKPIMMNGEQVGTSHHTPTDISPLVSTHQIDISEFAAVIKATPFPKFFRRFNQYDLFFPNFVELNNELGQMHVDFIDLAENFIELYPVGDISIGDGIGFIKDLRVKQSELSVIRNQMFKFFQYECLKPLQKKKIKLPNFSDHTQIFIERNPETGELTIKEGSAKAKARELKEQLARNS